MTAKLGTRRGLALLAAVVVGLGVWAFARAELGAERARAALARALGARLGASVELQRVALSLSERRVHAQGVKLHAPWGRLAARELTAEVSWLELVRGEVAPDGFQLQGAQIELDLRAMSAAPRTSTEPLPSLRLRDATLTLRHEHALVVLNDVRLDLDGDRVSLAAQGGRWSAQDRTLALGSVALAGRSHAQGWVFDTGNLTVADARVALAALELPAPLGRSARGKLRAEGALAPLLALVGTSLPLDGRAQITGRFALGPEGRSFELDTELTQPRFAGQPLAPQARLQLAQVAGASALSLRAELGGDAAARSLEATLVPSPQGFTASALQLHAGGSTLAGSGELAGERLRARLAADDAAIAELVAALGALRAGQGALTGRGRVELSVEGTPASPALALRAELREGTLLGARFERAVVAAHGTTEPGALVLDELSLQAGKSRLSAERLQVREDAQGRPYATGELRVEKLPLSELWKLLGTPDDARAGAGASALQGDADGRITLTRDERGAPQAGLTLQLRAATLHGLRFATGALEATLKEAGRVELQSLTLRDAGSSLALSGTLGGSAAFELRGKLERLSLAELASGAPSWLGLSGRASGSATFSGKPAAPDAAIDVTLDELALLGVPLGKQTLRAQLVSTSAEGRRCDDASAPLDLPSLRAAGVDRAWLVCSASQALRASLALGTGGDLPVRGRLESTRADVGAVFAARSASPDTSVPARASFALDLEGGGLRAPGTLSFALAVRELTVGEGKRALAASAPFTLRSKRGVLSLQGGELAAEHTRLSLGVDGSLPHARLTAKGTIAAGALLVVAPVPLVTAAFGDVAIDAALPLDGAPAHFRLQPQGAIVHFGTGVVARQVRGSIALEASGLELEELTAQVGPGTLRARGTLGRRGGAFDRYDLQLTATDVAIAPADRFDLTLDAELRLRSLAKAGPPTLSGRVRVERFVYGRHIQLPEALIAINQADRRERASYDPARDRIAFDLELEQAAPLVVRNRMIDAELRVEGQARTLRVVGTNQRFGLLGAMQATRGRVLFHGDEFAIARAAVSFGDQTRVAPVFELRAVAAKRARKDASIVLEAKGDRETFSLGLHCDASGARVLAKPFTCEFARDVLRCDKFDQLATLWSCPVRTELTRVEGR